MYVGMIQEGVEVANTRRRQKEGRKMGMNDGRMRFIPLHAFEDKRDTRDLKPSVTANKGETYERPRKGG